MYILSGKSCPFESNICWAPVMAMNVNGKTGHMSDIKMHGHIRRTPNLAGHIHGKKFLVYVLVYFSIVVLLWQAIITLQKIAIQAKVPYV